MLDPSLLCGIQKYSQKDIAARHTIEFTLRVNLFWQMKFKIRGQKRNKKRIQ